MRGQSQLSLLPDPATLPLPRPGPPGKSLSRYGPVWSLARVMTKCVVSTQFRQGTQKCLASLLQTFANPRNRLLQETPCPHAWRSRPASQRPAPQEAACPLYLLESVQAGPAGPTWTTSRPGSNCLLPHLCLLTDDLHPQPSPPADQPGVSGCQLCGCSKHPEAGPPSCPRAGPRKQERPDPQHFLWICFQGPSHFLCSQGPPGSSSSFPGSRYGPSQAGESPRNLIPEASSSHRSILPRPQAPFLAPQAGNYPDTAQGCPGAEQLLKQPEWGGVPQGPLPQAYNYCPPPSAYSVGRHGIKHL